MGLRRRKVRDPQWGLAPGDVLTLDGAGGSTARVQVVDSQAPTKEYDYRRLTVRVVEPADVVVAGERGEDSVVPVGSADEPVELSFGATTESEVMAVFETALGVGFGPCPTAGLAVVVPDDDGGSADDPARAGFTLAGREAPPVQADGMAVMVSWEMLAERLRAATRTLG